MGRGSASASRGTSARTGSPSSKWVRVSQAWAGAGFGAMFIPRIGEEVLVAYMNGDVDEPMIVGRVYNIQNPLPSDAGAEPEVSTLKSHSTPRAEGSNEIRFQDLAGREELYFHAQKNLKEVVRADHTSNVGGIRSSAIGGDEHLVVGGSRTTSVALDVVTNILGDAATTVGADRIHRVEGSDFLTVEENRTAELHGSETHSVTGDRSISVSGDHGFYTLGAFHAVADEGHAFYSKGSFTSRVTEDHHFATHGTFASDAGDRHTFHSPAVSVTSDTTELIQKKSLVARVGSTFIKITDGMITLNDGSGASLSLCGGKLVVNAASDVTIASSGDITLKSSGIHLKSGSAERKDEKFKDEEEKATFVFRVHADELNHPHWDDTYTLKASDGSFSQSKDATDDGERHETGRSDIEFTDVPVGKKYDLTVERDGQTIVLLQDYEFEG